MFQVSMFFVDLKPQLTDSRVRVRNELTNPFVLIVFGAVLAKITSINGSLCSFSPESVSLLAVIDTQFRVIIMEKDFLFLFYGFLLFILRFLISS